MSKTLSGAKMPSLKDKIAAQAQEKPLAVIKKAVKKVLGSKKKK